LKELNNRSHPIAHSREIHDCDSLITSSKEIDADSDGHITYDEMKSGLQRWFNDMRTEHDAVRGARGSRAADSSTAVLLDQEQQLIAAAGFEDAHDDADDKDDGGDDESEKEAMTPSQIKMAAATKLLFGALVRIYILFLAAAPFLSLSHTHTHTHGRYLR